MEESLECALKSLLNIAEEGGYLKTDTKEDNHHAESVIRKCFITMKRVIHCKNKDEKMLQIEVTKKTWRCSCGGRQSNKETINDIR